MSITAQPTNGGAFHEALRYLQIRGPYPKNWMAQPKWDGHRAVISPVGILSRHNKPLAGIPENLAKEAKALARRANWDLDAELLGTRDDGPKLLVIHDLMSHLPYKERRRILLGLGLSERMDRPEFPGIYLTGHSDNLEVAWETARYFGHEGIVIKDGGGYPALGTTKRWLKFRFADQPNQEAKDAEVAEDRGDILSLMIQAVFNTLADID